MANPENMVEENTEKSKRSKLRILSHLILICISFFVCFHIPSIKTTEAAESISTHTPGATSTFTEYSKEKNPLELFDFRHSPYVDHRLIQGLSEAFKEYARLFKTELGEKKDVLVKVSLSVDQLNMENYRVIFQITMDDEQKDYEVTYSTNPHKLPHNLHLLSETLKTFSNDFGDYVLPFKSIQTAKTKKVNKDEISVREFSDNALLKSIKAIESEITQEQFDPKQILKVSEIFSWLSIFKGTHENNTLSNLLATNSVSNFLIAVLFFDSNDKVVKYYKGLLSLALHYENEALKQFQSLTEKPNEMTVILSYFIKNDIDKLKDLLRQGGSNKVLVRYLLGRAYETSNQESSADEQILKLIYEYPDFLTAKEYIVQIGSLGVMRSVVDELLFDTIENDLHMIKFLFQTNWANNDGEFQFSASREVDEGGLLQKWIEIHKEIIDKSKKFKGPEKILTSHFIKSFLKQNLLNRFYLSYKIQEYLCSLPGLSETLHIIENVYPESDVVKSMKIRVRKRYKKYDEMFHYIDSIDTKHAGTFLLENILDIYQWWPTWERWPKIVDAIHEYRKKQNHDSKGSRLIQYYYSELNYQPVALGYLKRIQMLNTYNYNSCIKLMDYSEGRDYIKENEKYFPHLYGFIIGAARWYKNNKQYEKAVPYFELALELAPKESTSYKHLGYIYFKQKKYDEAIDIWKEYFKYDNQTLKAVHLKNEIGGVFLKKKQYEKAYNIYNEVKDSYQAGALTGFAEASEKMNNDLQAEEYYQKAAERYPSGSCPEELSLFYLRQGNTSTAYKVLNEYKRYNTKTYYFSTLINFYKEQNNPKKAIDVALEVNRGDNEEDTMNALASKFAKNKMYDISASIYKKLAYSTPTKHYVPFYVSYFFNVSMQGKLKTENELFKETMYMLKADKHYLGVYGNELINMGYYDSAFKVFDKVDQVFNKEKYATMMLMALTWRAGSKIPEHKATILKRLKKYKINKWYKNVIMYLLGDVDERTVFSLVSNINQKCEIHYFTGIIKLAENKRVEAFKHLLQSLETKACGNIEFRYAYEKLEQIAE